jgi:AhpD family alkylhydroperoxidase
MQERMKNPGVIIPDAMKAIQDLNKAIYSSGLPAAILTLAHLRASQINGCSSCVDAGSKNAKRQGESDDRLFAVAAWRDAPYFSDSERAALALTEAVTRMADKEDAVPDEVFDEAAKQFDEEQLAALILAIATTNVFNRLNRTTRQVAGATSWR